MACARFGFLIGPIAPARLDRDGRRGILPFNDRCGRERSRPPMELTFICVTCGTQYPPSASAEPPANCPICDDDRQYVGPNGQQWTSLADLRASHANEIVAVDAGLTGIATAPSFAIGQQA